MPRHRQNPRVAANMLAQRTLELVDIPSESRHEAEIGAYVRAAVSLPVLYDDGDTTLFGRRRPGTPLVVLAGHLDTVPAQGNLPGRLEDGVVHGLGASDMKAGLVVMLEPTDNEVHAGCLGNLNARLRFEGVSAHSARPWLGRNAVHAAIESLAAVAALQPLDVEVEGLVFREVASVVRIEGGLAQNVVPAEAVAELNYRYAPNRTPAEAERRFRELVPGGEIVSLANSPPAHVVVDTPLVRRLREAGPFALRPKQAWTPVAEFAAQGLDAVNLGPGATRYAHARDERV